MCIWRSTSASCWDQNKDLSIVIHATLLCCYADLHSIRHWMSEWWKSSIHGLCLPLVSPSASLRSRQFSHNFHKNINIKSHVGTLLLFSFVLTFVLSETFEDDSIIYHLFTSAKTFWFPLVLMINIYRCYGLTFNSANQSRVFGQTGQWEAAALGAGAQ